MQKIWEQLQTLQLKQADRVAPVLLALLILYLCWKLASLFWLLLAPPQAMQLDRVELGSQQLRVPNISSFALFHEASQRTQAEDNLNLQLQGVMVGYPNQFSSAVLKVNEVAERYRVGDVIEGSGYQLAEVYWDRVVLRHSSGATREIEFKGIENGLNQPIVPTQSPAAPNRNPAPATTAQNAIGQAVQKIQQDRERYLQDMGVNSGNGQGYEITARTPVALRSRLGLQPGDRILSLNGQTVGQGQNEAQLLEQARQDGQVRLEVQRGDQVITVQQDFK